MADAIAGAPLVHAEERARRVPGGGVGRAARRQPASSCRWHAAARAQRVGLCGRRRRDARNRRALCGLLRPTEAARLRGASPPRRGDSGRAVRRAHRGLPMQVIGLPVVVEGARDASRRGSPAPRCDLGGPRLSSRRCAFRSCTAARSTSAIARARRASPSSARAWRGEYFGDASTPSDAGSGSSATRRDVDRGHRRGAGHGPRPAGRSRRSRPAFVLPIVHAVEPPADHRRWRGPRSMRRASSARCSRSCAP